MHPRKLAALAATGVLSTILMLSSGGAASAVAGCPPGQPPGRPPGQNGNSPGPSNGRASQYPIGVCQLQLSQNAATPHTSVRASGSGYSPHSGVRLSLGGRDVGSATTDANGAFTTNFVVPDIAPGDYQVDATGADASGPRVLSAAFTVTSGPPGAAPARASAGLPATGSSRTVPLTTAALIQIALGICIVVVARRRQTA